VAYLATYIEDFCRFWWWW